jgi:hypothetical protein
MIACLIAPEIILNAVLRIALEDGQLHSRVIGSIIHANASVAHDSFGEREDPRAVSTTHELGKRGSADTIICNRTIARSSRLKQHLSVSRYPESIGMTHAKALRPLKNQAVRVNVGLSMRRSEAPGDKGESADDSSELHERHENEGAA